MSFPFINKNIQQGYEKQQEGQPDLTPEICGYYGRACRQMDKAEGANRANCMSCALAAFAQSVVQEDEFSVARCGHCNAELLCNDCGDMPATCPSCGKPFDWSLYAPSTVQTIKPGDVCVYSFGDENSSVAVVEVVKVLDDLRGVAEIKFRKVIRDDTGNGLFNYLQKTGKTMNASFKYLTAKGHWQLSTVEIDSNPCPIAAGYWCSICGGPVTHDDTYLTECPHCGAPVEVTV